MIDVFGKLRGLLKPNDVTIDNEVFFLHYTMTPVLLIACSLIVFARQYVGDPIDCVMDLLPPGYVDSYCWTTATHTMPGGVNQNVIRPSVSGPLKVMKYHKYYLRVCFLLLIQAAFFYAPRLEWKVLENGLVRSLAVKLRGQMSDEERVSCVRQVANRLARDGDELDAYSNGFFACELFNLLNALCHMLFVELDGYGKKMLFDLRSPKNRIFPQVTMCTFLSYSPSGSIQSAEGLCVLPVNKVNESIFEFLHALFWFMSGISTVNAIYRLSVLLRPGFRLNKLRTKVRLSPGAHAMTAMMTARIGCWFVLDQLAKNINRPIFKEVFIQLSRKLEKKRSDEDNVI